MRFLNERHYCKYVEKAREYDVPAYVFFKNTTDGTEILCRVDDDGRVLRTTKHDYMLPFRDGNNAAYMTSGTDENIGRFINYITTE
jgi:hypothetical protein